MSRVGLSLSHATARRMRRTLGWCAVMVAASGLGGCAPKSVVGAGRAYPAEQRQQSWADVQVVRHETRIAITNTSARTLGPGTLWLNGAFGRPFDRLGVGERVELALGSFRSEFGERFRAGGFFATEPPERLVQAQIEGPDGSLTGLIVVGDARDER